MERMLAAFDFDGTVTDRDTLPLFVRYLMGKWGMVKLFGRLMPEIVAARMGLVDGGKIKQRLLEPMLKGRPCDAMSETCRKFAEANRGIVRPAALAEIERQIAAGREVAIVSASPEIWVRAFFEGMPVRIIATELEDENGVLTGRFASPNCNGSEKVRRLMNEYPGLTSERLIAYGDSKGDREMLSMASERHYKPFR